jgi:acetyl esterase/lipase
MAKGAAAALAVVAGLYGASCPALAQPSSDEPEIAAEPVTDDNYPERRVVFSGDVIGLPDLTYPTRSGFRPLKLDLYLPSDSMPKPEAGFPLVVHIHGGGWMAGHPRHSGAFADFPAVLASLAARGYVVASWPPSRIA